MRSHSYLPVMPGPVRRIRSAAFTLVELLVVIAIIGMIVAIAAPSIEPMMKGSKLTTGSDDLRFKLSEYRQRAIAENSPIEIRFLKFIDPSLPGRHEAYRGYIAGRFRQEKRENGAGDYIFEPLDHMQKLPDGLVFASSPDLSTLLFSDKVRKGTHPFLVEGQNNLPYVSFSFRPDGSTDLPKRAGDIWCYTLASERDDIAANPNPDNFVTHAIDAFNGALRVYTR
jgi:uncharacterized protein (TIGR02596 family)